MSDSNDVLEHGDWRHAADVISMITKYARQASQGQVPLYVATVAHVPDTDPNPVWSVSPLRQVLRRPLPEMGWSSEDVFGGEGLVFIGDESDVRVVDFRKREAL